MWLPIKFFGLRLLTEDSYRGITDRLDRLVTANNKQDKAIEVLRNNIRELQDLNRITVPYCKDKEGNPIKPDTTNNLFHSDGSYISVLCSEKTVPLSKVVEYLVKSLDLEYSIGTDARIVERLSIFEPKSSNSET